MNSLMSYVKLTQLGKSVLTTSQVSEALKFTTTGASKLLGRLATAGLIEPLCQGYWLFDLTASAFEIATELVSAENGYITSYSALFFYGMIDQIPDMINVASNGRPRIITTSRSRIKVQQLQPPLLTGFDKTDGFLIAGPEKAYFDTLYLLNIKHKRALKPVEISLNDKFDFEKLNGFIDLIPQTELQARMQRHVKNIGKTLLHDQTMSR